MSTYLADKAENLTVEAPAATFTYRRMGPQGGVPLVLLHRFRATIDWWDPEFSTRLAAGGPGVSEAAAHGLLTAVGKLLQVPFDQTQAELEAIKHPVLYANGLHDVMIPAHASYVAIQHLDNATLVLYGDAGHGFLFQHAKAFATEVANFLAA